MYKDYKISAPYFEFGPKAYLWGEKLLELALVNDAAAQKYDVDVLLTPQYTDIPLMAANMKRVHVYAQHVDPLVPGRGLGSVLPEAVKAAGAVGTMLNHAEKKLDLPTIDATIRRCDEVGLATIVCADTLDELTAIAKMSPNLIVAEPTALIGTGTPSSMDYVRDTIKTVRDINPDIIVLQGAGISKPEDVYNVIMAGADATGCTSGIIKAPDPKKMADDMLHALRAAWDERHRA